MGAIVAQRPTSRRGRCPRRPILRGPTPHAFGWSYRARRGPPAAVLATAAEEHDAYLIVVGRHEHAIGEQLRRLIDGSTSHSLLDRCGRPVLVVPAEH